MKVGTPVSGHTVYPIYVNNQLVVPAGTPVSGEVSQVTAAPHKTRLDAKLHGDFTPLRVAKVRFESLLLPSQRVALDAPPAGDGVEVVRFQTPDALAHRKSLPGRLWSGLMDRRKSAQAEFTAPGKMDRVKRLVYSELPLHPEPLTAGLQYTVQLAAPVEAPMAAPASQAKPANKLTKSAIISARLLRPLTSKSALRGMPVEAVVTEPLLGANQQVEVPQGTLLEGKVMQAKPAGKWGRNGVLRFAFEEIRFPAGFRQPVHGSARSVDADQSMSLRMDAEGGATPQRRSAIAPLAMGLLASSAIHEDEASVVHTAGASNGFALIGRIIAVASRSQYVGAALGMLGTARTVYTRFIGHGTDVSFPQNTRIEIAVDPVNSPLLHVGER